MDATECEAAMYEALETERAKILVDSVNKHLEKPIEIYLRKCGVTGAEGTSRAFFAAPPPAIVLCYNRLHSLAEVNEVLVHELIHAYDYTVRERNIVQGPELACSEIRAAREAECYEKEPKLCKSLAGHELVDSACRYLKERCVRVNACTATRAMFPDIAESLVKEKFQECFQDHDPFTNPNPPTHP